MFSRHEWDGAPLREQAYGPRYIARSSLVRKTIESLRPKNVLDIGCGSGNITKHVAAFSGHVHAIDLYPEAIEVARENLADLDNVSFEAGNVFAAGEEATKPFVGKYDLIVLSEVLEHLDDDIGTLRTIANILPTGGRLLLTVPGDPKQWSVDDELSGHKRRYTRAELRSKLRQAGFRIERCTNWGFPFTRSMLTVERRMMGKGGIEGVSTSPVRLLLRPASFLFRLNGVIEPYFSFLDAGVGYVVLARKAGAGDGRSAQPEQRAA